MKNLRINRRELPTLRILLYDSGALRTEVRTTSVRIFPGRSWMLLIQT
jgi:hypothetical protein